MTCHVLTTQRRDISGHAVMLILDGQLCQEYLCQKSLKSINLLKVTIDNVGVPFWDTVYICESKNKKHREYIKMQPWEVRLIYGARIIGGKSKPKCTITLTTGFSNPNIDTFANAHRPTTEANTFNAIDSFGTATIVWQTNVNAVCCMKEYWPTVQRCNAQLIYAIIACNRTQCNVIL